MVIDKRTRYPEVETVYSTAVKPTKEKLKKIFATYGTPERLESDNGPPFNSREFAMFASEEGFRHHCVTPLHPQANGEAENFMKLLNKTEQRARIENKPVRLAIQKLLTGYRSTPHPATGVTPYDAMMDRKVKTKLDYVQPDLIAGKVKQSKVNKRDMEYKMKIKSNAENRNTKSHNLSDQFKKIVKRYIRVGYNLDIMRQSACLVVNPITVYSYGFLFNCTTVGRASDSMTALT